MCIFDYICIYIYRYIYIYVLYISFIYIQCLSLIYCSSYLSNKSNLPKKQPQDHLLFKLCLGQLPRLLGKDHPPSAFLRLWGALSELPKPPRQQMLEEVHRNRRFLEDIRWGYPWISGGWYKDQRWKACNIHVPSHWPPLASCGEYHPIYNMMVFKFGISASRGWILMFFEPCCWPFMHQLKKHIFLELNRV